MLDYLVVYDSETGNTKKIATENFRIPSGDVQRSDKSS